MSNQLPLFVGWSVAMAASVAFAVKSPDASLEAGTVIAQLSARKGTVQFRQEGVSLWLDAGAEQRFADGTLLATGAGSKASVAFRDGRKIVLGESSQVFLTVGDAKSDSVVTLLKGSLETPKVAKAPSSGKAPTRLIINSGNKSVALAKPEDAVTIKKTVGTVAPKIAMLGGLPSIAAPIVVRTAAQPALPVEKLAVAAPEITPRPIPTAMPVAALAPKIDLNPEPGLDDDVEAEEAQEVPSSEDEILDEAEEEEDEEEPIEDVAEATPEPVLALQLSAPRIVSPASGTRLWTSRSLVSGQSAGLTLALATDGALPLADVNATVDLVRGNRALRALKVTRSGNQYVARLDGSSVTTAGTREQGLPAWTMNLRSRVAPKPGREEQVAPVQGRMQELTIASLADFPKGSASAYLAKIEPKAGQGWIPQTGTATPATAAAGVHLRDSSELVVLEPLLRGSGAFALSSRTKGPAGGTQIVRDGKVVAHVMPDQGDASRWVRRALRADLAFKGSASDYLGSGTRLAAVRDTVSIDTPSGRVTLYDTSYRPAEVTARLFKKRPQAFEALGTHARAVFKKPTLLIDPPEKASVDVAGDIAQVQAAIAEAGATAAAALGIPERLIFVQGIEDGGEPKFKRLDHRKFNSLGVVTAASAGQSTFALNLNPSLKKRLASIDRSTPTALVEQALALAEADAVVLSPDDEDEWIIAVVEDGKLKRLAAAKPPEKSDDTLAVHAWVLETLGVTDRTFLSRGRAAMSVVPRSAKPGRQGVVVGQDGKGNGIVELATVDGDLGVVRLVFGGDPSTPLPAGTRILWE